MHRVTVFKVSGITSTDISGDEIKIHVLKEDLGQTEISSQDLSLGDKCTMQYTENVSQNRNPYNFINKYHPF